MNFAWSTPLDDAEMFELAPVALLLEDFSGVRRMFEGWRAAGVTDLRAHLWDNPELVFACYEKIRVLKVNRQALRLFGAPDFAAMVAGLRQIPQIHGHRPYVERLVRLWDGEVQYSYAMELHTLRGERLDIRLHGMFLPGHATDWSRTLVSLEDVSVRERALRRLTASEGYARALFDLSPVSLWVEDFSEIKRLMDGLRASGVTDFRAHVAGDPHFALRCMRAIRFVDVNRATLAMFGAPDKEALIDRPQDVLPDNVLPDFADQLAALWDGALQYHNEAVNYALDGRALNVLLQLSVMPDHEADWSRVLVALTDITARKQAEARLAFLGRHDALTELFNRAVYLEEMARLETGGPFPISVFVVDLDGLKAVNDAGGHAAGDELLRRAGRVLQGATERPCCAARLGGDEFALIVPATGRPEAEAIRARIDTLVERDNKDQPTALRLSIGVEVCDGPGCLEASLRQADLHMYAAKRAFYATTPRGEDRRLH